MNRRKCLEAIAAAPFLGGRFAANAAEKRDPRNIAEGNTIPFPGMQYVDQPYVVKLPDGAWLCMVTTGTLGETVAGSVNTSVVAISRDRGKTWSPPVEASKAAYCVPLATPSGRIYAIRPPVSFTYSDDRGASWSRPYVFAEDVGMVRGVRNGWSVSMPIVAGGNVYLAWAFIGRNRPPRDTEVFVYRSDNILAEKDPAAIRWERLPAGGAGLRGPDWDKPEHRSEEPHVAALSDGSLYMVWRTDQGYIGQSSSRDGGRTWSTPSYATYASDGRRIKHPLACPSLWKCANGKYLLWIHNHSGTYYDDRNPAWICGGVEKDGRIAWSEPEILLYSDDLTYHSGRLSYPGFLEDRGRYWIFETQKTLARVHEVDARVLAAVWGQAAARGVAKEGLALALSSSRCRPGASARMPRLPVPVPGGGFSIDLWLRCRDFTSPGTVLSSRDSQGRGLAVLTTAEQTLRLELSDGRRTTGWSCDPGRLESGKLHHVVFIVDGGPRLITLVVDGRQCDGGPHRRHGYGRLNEATPGGSGTKPVESKGDLGDVSGAERLLIAERSGVELASVRIYSRYLLTSEAVGNFHAGAFATS